MSNTKVYLAPMEGLTDSMNSSDTAKLTNILCHLYHLTRQKNF